MAKLKAMINTENPDNVWKLTSQQRKEKISFKDLPDGKFFEGFALKYQLKSGGTRRRLVYKVYVPEEMAEAFIVYGLYIKLHGIKSISMYFEQWLESEVAKIDQNDPLFQQAKEIYNEFKRQNVLQSYNKE